MLIERNQATIGLIAGAVLAGMVFFSLFMTQGFFDRGDELTAVFADAAGLSEGDQVLVAGVRSGQVNRVEPNGDVVEVDFTVDVDLPRDTRARITIQNLLGRRQLLIQAGSDWSELLEDGATIPLERTSTPVDVPDFGEATEELSRGADEDALQAVVTALADITEDQRDEVADLLDGLTRIGEVIDDRRDELQETFIRSEELFRAFADRDQEIVRIVDSFGSTVGMLRERRADVEQLLQETAGATEVLADLIETERARIDRVLFGLHEDLRVVDRNQVDIAHFFAYAGQALIGFSEIGYRGLEREDNPYWANMRVQDIGPVGVDALFGCGGTVDRALDDLFGEDPRTCEEQDAEPRPDEPAADGSGAEGDTQDDGDGGDAGPLAGPGLSSFFPRLGEGVGR
jgi:phospholipid/cholesterol/gamma-HCH transport system substrate-binding protein